MSEQPSPSPETSSHSSSLQTCLERACAWALEKLSEPTNRGRAVTIMKYAEGQGSIRVRASTGTEYHQWRVDRLGAVFVSAGAE